MGKTSNRSKTAKPKHIVGTQRQIEAVELRIKGYTYRQIGEALDIADQSAWQLVNRAMISTVEHLSERAEHVRQIELERLDRIAIRALEKAETGDPRAIEAYLKVAQQRARLTGLDESRITVRAEWQDILNNSLE